MIDNFSRFCFRPGWVEVICGCMFSGKTEELIAQIRRAEIAKKKYLVFKPAVDTRYCKDHVASHDRGRTPSIVVHSALEILEHVERTVEVIGIDEAQFFDDGLVEVCQKLADSGKRVILAGLDTDYLGRPFGPMPQLMATADVVQKKYAICMVCGAPATRTQRLVSSQDSVLLGSSDSYEARCRIHFDADLSVRLKSIPKDSGLRVKGPEISQ